MTAGLAGDDEQKGYRGGDKACVGYETAVIKLEFHDIAHGEGHAVSAGDLADSQQHEHQRQLTGDDRDHLAAQTDAGVGRAGGRAAEHCGHSRDEQQIEDDDNVRHAGESREAVNGDEQLQHDQRGEAHDGCGHKDRA